MMQKKCLNSQFERTGFSAGLVADWLRAGVAQLTLKRCLHIEMEDQEKRKYKEILNYESAHRFFSITMNDHIALTCRWIT